MKSILALIALAASLAAAPNALAQRRGPDLLNLAFETKSQIAERLAACGTETLDPLDPRLPPPLVPVHEAFVNVESAWLGGYFFRETFGGSQDFIYKWPNGGKIAWIEVGGDSELRFLTPYNGLVAKMTKYYTDWGVHFYFRCGSDYVDEAFFRQCIEAYWVQPLLASLCI